MAVKLSFINSILVIFWPDISPCALDLVNIGRPDQFPNLAYRPPAPLESIARAVSMKGDKGRLQRQAVS